MLVTVSDRRLQIIPALSGTSGVVADLLSASDYYAAGGMLMPGRQFNANAYRYGYNKGSEKDDEISGAGNHITTLHRALDTRLGRWWSTDPKEQENPDHSPYCSMGNNPIQNNDPNGDIFIVDNLIGAAVGAVVDYGFQAASNVCSQGWSVAAFTSDIDKISVGLSAGAGFLTSGLSSGAILAKGFTKNAVVQVAKLEGKYLAVNTAEATLKQVNTSVKEGKTFKESVKSIVVKDALIDGVIANVASNIPGGKTKGMKQLETKAENKVAKSLHHPSPYRLGEADKALKKVAYSNISNEAGKETLENAAQAKAPLAAPKKK